MTSIHHDSDEHKGAVESESPNDTPKRTDLHSNLADQLGHRNSDPMIKDNDSDFPEPGSNAEHSGQHE
ncbi:hypothetical protein [Acidipila rosea]|uniref:Uncharacterized protein n=1 Tax=Acidipila rosea TaxID=768535 RepID=A0A4R1L6H5_9BACT|nr:hypothetical protein [Acidipila rosea]MBW4026884.1 hypothetical protein [Acidobacteriota bacterium]MBW4043463.1 hypothetical protein [Acidobacteriota bacterium]TCK73765.1 hypothetical protein C7378_1379 [Acidipila rosea]